MTNNSSVEDDEAFIAAILALEAQIRSPEGAAFVVEHFSELLATTFVAASTLTCSTPC
jgi:hypothetical protein